MLSVLIHLEIKLHSTVVWPDACCSKYGLMLDLYYVLPLNWKRGLMLDLDSKSEIRTETSEKLGDRLIDKKVEA